MDKLYSTIRTEECSYEIRENSLAGTKPWMEPLQKKFKVYQIINRIIGGDLAYPLNDSNGGFETLKECEKAIEVSCGISFFEQGWFKSIEIVKDINGKTINNWFKRIETTWDENGKILNGIEQSFYGNGILSNIETFKNGKLHGINKSWHKNG